jgi:hypothetical protein
MEMVATASVKLLGAFGQLTGFDAVKNLGLSAAKRIQELTKQNSSFEQLTPQSRSTPGYAVPLHAAGGIVTSPHFGIVGEQGPEAIIPLSNQNVLDDLNSTLKSLQNGIREDYAFLSPDRWFKHKGRKYRDNAPGSEGLVEESENGSSNARVHLTYNISTIEAKDVHRVVKVWRRARRRTRH